MVPWSFLRPNVGLSVAQPDNGACADYQASTQFEPIVIEAHSAEMLMGEDCEALSQTLIKARGARLDQRHYYQAFLT